MLHLNISVTDLKIVLKFVRKEGSRYIDPKDMTILFQNVWEKWTEYFESDLSLYVLHAIISRIFQ